MEEQLKEKGIQYLSNMLDNLQKGSDFVVEQTPLVVQEYLTWNLWEYALYSVAFLIPIIIIWSLYRFWWNRIKDVELPKVGKYLSYGHTEFDQGDRTALRWVWISINWALTVLFLCVSFAHMLGAVKIWLAPRVFLIEKLSYFLKSVT